MTFPRVAHHVVPDSLTGGLLLDYRPYADESGDLSAARNEMALSRYDHDGDGVCDARVCTNVHADGLIFEGQEEDSWGVPAVVVPALRTLGIEVDLDVETADVVADPLAAVKWVRDEVTRGEQAISIEAEWWWLPDYLDASSFVPQQFGGGSVADPARLNLSFTGASPQQLRDLGMPVTHVPSIDARIEACRQEIASEQVSCWAALDQYITEEIVPVVPLFGTSSYFVTSPRVVSASVTQWTSSPALDRIALDPAS